MIIYQDTKAGFIDDVERKRLLPKLEDSFRLRTGSVPSDRSVWESEYSDFAWDLKAARVDEDVPVAIEYHLTSAGRFRLDILLAGHDGIQDNALIVEMKGWEDASASTVPDMVETVLKGSQVTVQHPCAQALGYRDFIVSFNEDIELKGIGVHACAYLNRMNRRPSEPLEDAAYAELLGHAPLFLLDDRDRLRAHLGRLVPKRPKSDVFWIIENGRLRPSKHLADCVGRMLRGNEEFRLIDAQNVAYKVVRHAIFTKQRTEGRHVFIIEGGPGSGKSVIAIRLLADLYKRSIPGFFVAPNAAFRKTLETRLSEAGKDMRRAAKLLFQSSWGFHDEDYLESGRHEVLIVDEAHRLKDKAYRYYGDNMVADMVRAARISVFFIDETQRVSWNDCGSIAEIRSQAAIHGAQVHVLPPLTAQFRCNGSNGYVNWVDDALQIRGTANFDSWGDGQYQFEVFENPADLYGALKEKNGGNRARIIAGYAWEWPSEGRIRASQSSHIELDGLNLPWNFKGENWATSPDGIGQVGCIHTCQGSEFDWVGVLIGKDLIYRDGRVIGVPTERAKTDQSLKGSQSELVAAKGDLLKQQEILHKIQSIIKNTYKVLLTRGQRGCFVWCADRELREYVKMRLQIASLSVHPGRAAEVRKPYTP